MKMLQTLPYGYAVQNSKKHYAFYSLFFPTKLRRGNTHRRNGTPVVVRIFLFFIFLNYETLDLTISFLPIFQASCYSGSI